MSKRKKLLGPIEWIMFLFAIAILGYILLQNGGFNVMEKTETIEIVDNPGKNDPRKSPRRYEDRRSEESVEAVLKELANQFSDQQSYQPASSSGRAETGISDDEMKYYRDVKNKYELNDKIKNAKDWFKVLKAANDTYRKLQSTFGEAAGQSPEMVATDDVEFVLNHAKSANNLYSSLKKYFNISEEESRAFAKRGKKSLSDWAAFVEEQQKGE